MPSGISGHFGISFTATGNVLIFKCLTSYPEKSRKYLLSNENKLVDQALLPENCGSFYVLVPSNLVIQFKIIITLVIINLKKSIK
jgi:hypothetical protein